MKPFAGPDQQLYLAAKRQRARALFLLIATIATCFLLAVRPSHAHEVRPALLTIEEAPTGDIRILWKQPVVGDRTIAIRPRLTSGWLDEPPSKAGANSSALYRQWDVPSPHPPLAGQVLTIEGLALTLTDVLVRIRYADGSEIPEIVRPQDASLPIPAPGASGGPVLSYFWLGMTHIWSGTDHLLYILGLVLLVAAVRPLILTLTSFTLAHSITLALTTLDLVRLPSAPVEAVIALSIVYLAVELLRQARGEHGLATRHPGLIAFPFGLLHGFGFAGALQEVGLPAANIPAALLLFNLGIEAGQIAFVAVVLVVAVLVRKLRPIELTAARRIGAYALGVTASYWLFTRMLPV